MANTIKIKRSQTTATPVTLEEGELAYSETSGNLFIGTSGANISKIGGNTDVLALSTHIGDATIHFTEGSIDHTAIQNIGTNTHAQIDTAVSNSVSHIADGTIHFTQGAIDIPASQINDFSTAVGLVINTTSLDDLADVNIDGSPAVQVNDVLQWNGTAWVNVNVSTVGVTDHTNLTNIGTNTHAQIDTKLGNSVSHIADGTIHFTEGSIDHTAIQNIGTNTHAQIDTHIGDATIHYTQASISITESQISDLQAYALDNAVVHLTGAETVGGAKTFSNDMVINGDLTVNGTTTTIDSDNTTIADNIITLNSGEVGAGVTLGTAGIEIDRGTEFNVRMVWDETTDAFGYTDASGSPVGTFTAFSVAGHTHDAGDIISGTFANARISESSVTQHVGAIDHDSLLNYVANDHVDHSTVSVTAGVGLTGGGDITASRTVDLDLNSLASVTVTDGAADYAVVYQPGSPTGHKKILIDDLLDGGTF